MLILAVQIRQMSPVSLLPIIPILLISLLVSAVVNRWLGVAPPQGRYIAVDGIRGYLAIFVFLHHSSLWFFYLRNGGWPVPPSLLYSHFGPSSVSLFFMITSFLFFSKLLGSKGKQMDWGRLYISRVMRIYPLFLFAFLVVLLIVFSISNWTLQVPVGTLLKECFSWLVFMQPDINAVPGTAIIIAGVVWSLAFEWLFYCSLPCWGVLLFKIKTRPQVLILSGVFLLGFLAIILYFYPGAVLRRLSPFAGGMIAAFAIRNQRLCRLAASRYASVLVVLLLSVIVIFFKNVYSPVPLTCMTVVFFCIASGNTLFGILSHPASRQLGQISYSIYLLHGLLLSITFRFVLGMKFAAGLSGWEHWLVISACSVALAAICSFTHRFIELPGMNAVKGLEQRLRGTFARS